MVYRVLQKYTKLLLSQQGRLLVVIVSVNTLLLTQLLVTIRWTTTSVPTLYQTNVDVLTPSTVSESPLPPDNTLLCLFTSFSDDKRKQTVNDNTKHNWPLLNEDKNGRRVRPILYTDLVTSAGAFVTSARHLGWTVLQVPRASGAGLPFLKDMYFDAAKRFSDCTFYGFANGDILFNRGLVDSLEAVTQRLDVLNRTLVIGRRWNVIWENITSLSLPEEVTEVAKKYGTLHVTSAVDYFIIARNNFPWHQLPDVVIARRGYDNFLVMIAIQENVSVVDISETLVAVHQTDSESNDRRRHRMQHEFNMQSLRHFRAGYGYTSSSQFLTKYSAWDKSRNAKSIVVIRRRWTKLRTGWSRQL